MEEKDNVDNYNIFKKYMLLSNVGGIYLSYTQMLFTLWLFMWVEGNGFESFCFKNAKDALPFNTSEMTILRWRKKLVSLKLIKKVSDRKYKPGLIQYELYKFDFDLIRYQRYNMIKDIVDGISDQIKDC